MLRNTNGLDLPRRSMLCLQKSTCAIPDWHSEHTALSSLQQIIGGMKWRLRRTRDGFGFGASFASSWMWLSGSGVTRVVRLILKTAGGLVLKSKKCCNTAFFFVRQGKSWDSGNFNWKLKVKGALIAQACKHRYHRKRDVKLLMLLTLK